MYVSICNYQAIMGSCQQKAHGNVAPLSIRFSIHAPSLTYPKTKTNSIINWRERDRHRERERERARQVNIWKSLANDIN